MLIRKRFENFLRLRFTVPLLIFAMLSLAVTGELSYRHTVNTLRDGIALTEARLGTLRLLQLLTDAETAQRGYLLTGRAGQLQSLQAAKKEFQTNGQIFEYIGGIGATGPDDALSIYGAAANKLAELDRALSLADAGNRAAAMALVDSEQSKRMADRLRDLFDNKFKEAARLQDGARATIYSALWFNRSLVVLLALVVAIGLYLHLRQLQILDRVRNERQSVLQAQVASRTLELRNLARYLQTVREDEKDHLARELHDELGGLLTAAKMTLARMRAKLRDDPVMMERISHINSCLSDGIALKRRIVEDLRPSTLSTLGLNTALTILCTEARDQMGIPVQTALARVALTPEAELGVFRMVQEALTNIGKYAQATEVWVRLDQTHTELRLQITDNGVGFDVAALEAGRHGLAGMRFRAESLNGRLWLRSEPGKGVKITAMLPRQTVEFVELATAQPARPANAANVPATVATVATAVALLVPEEV
jgi:signal transduction histidine kinase